MLHIKHFVYNPIGVNTYVVSNEDGISAIVDCGCWTDSEWEDLKTYLQSNHLQVIHLLNTHFHADHVFGNKYAVQELGLKPRGSSLDYPLYASLHNQMTMFFGKRLADSMDYSYTKELGPALEEGDRLVLGDETLDVICTPGHSPGSICFYNRSNNVLFSGDTLFNSSIGRTDLPGGDYSTLIHSIETKLLVLPDETTVYSGHGPQTSILNEKTYNPYL